MSHRLPGALGTLVLADVGGSGDLRHYRVTLYQGRTCPGVTAFLRNCAAPPDPDTALKAVLQAEVQRARFRP